MAGRRDQRVTDEAFMHYMADAIRMRGENMYPSQTLRDLLKQGRSGPIDAEAVVDDLAARLSEG